MLSHGWRFPRFRRPLILPRAETRIFLWVMLEGVVHEYAAHRLYTCTNLGVRVYVCIRACTRGNTWHTRARIARTTAAERGQRVASSVNNADRGNGAISAHLLLNVRFVVLPPRVPPRVPVKRLLPRSPLPAPSYSPRATHLYPALNLHPGTAGLLPPWLLSSWRTDRGGGWPTVRSAPYLIVPRSEFRRDRQRCFSQGL